MDEHEDKDEDEDADEGDDEDGEDSNDDRAAAIPCNPWMTSVQILHPALPPKSSCNLFTVACSVCVTDSGPTTSQGKASNSRNMSRVFSLCSVIIPLNSHATWRNIDII